jgi:hypothetical protein
MSPLSNKCEMCNGYVESELMGEGYDLFELAAMLDGKYIREPIQMCYGCQQHLKEIIKTKPGRITTNADFYEKSEDGQITREEQEFLFGDACTFSDDNYYGAEYERD